ncbi:MarR family transcriptional regulator [Streptosporangiaceae bacterium NEAU-GS5]|nr:MarR family transcriptional regulator [Streptosporangiaceae bacterium NEAU-GS5]
MKSVDFDALVPEPAPPVALAGYTGFLLRRAFGCVQRVSVQVMPSGLHARHMAILQVVRHGPVSQRVLGDLLGVNRTIMVKLVDRLEEDGLIRRERASGDRRSYALELTEKGELALPPLEEAAGQGEAILTENLLPQERERLLDLLGRLAPEEVRQLPHQLTGRVAFYVANLHWRLSERADQALREFGMQSRRFVVLATLAQLTPCSQQELADALEVTAPALFGMLGELERDGLIRRGRNPADRRAAQLSLTERGRFDLDGARRVQDGIQAWVAGRLAPDSPDALNTLLLRISVW